MPDIILQYPDNASYERIRDDIDNLLRGVGGKIGSPIIKADDETDEGAALIAHVQRHGYQAEAGTVGTPVAANQFLLSSGESTLCGADLIQFTIVDGEITNYAITGGA